MRTTYMVLMYMVLIFLNLFCFGLAVVVGETNSMSFVAGCNLTTAAFMSSEFLIKMRNRT